MKTPQHQDLSMKTLQSDDLPKLPDEIKALVADGVYSLYEVNHPQVTYLLVTREQEFYSLTPDGDVVSESPIRTLSEADIQHAVSLVSDTQTVRINQE